MNAVALQFVPENTECIAECSNENVGQLVAIIFHEEKCNICILGVAIAIEFV